ncbi:MAG: stage II sporulation protein D [Clostridiales bacterium]|jgi:stage II sporulation protein D|nr:stage II sporulation protein D [Eubacteriales bacterium]MDH7567018.1 stage II sporulation protein D [Clostridiales bacterium]
MKKVAFYILWMLIIVILLPLLIVKGCTSIPGDLSSKSPPEDVKIKVYIKQENRIQEMGLEEYIKGVVAAEMPAEFNTEALKAQAVAARTYSFGRIEKVFSSQGDAHPGADVCTDSAHCQAWASRESMMKKWGIFAGIKNWNKIARAVNDTKGVIITYNHAIANPVFHSNSGGKTENAEEVWEGTEVPYLRSVPSEGEDASPDYKYTVSVKTEEFLDKLKNAYPEFTIKSKDVLKDIHILSYTAGGRVKDIQIGNITLKGVDVRKIFSLRSANFKIEKGEDDSLKITTLGYGHGVGMSQWGANYLAQKGGMYEEIIKYYYQGVELDTVSHWMSKDKQDGR